MEATSILPEGKSRPPLSSIPLHLTSDLGRISPEDAGLWTDTQIPPLQRIVHFSHTQGTKIGVQLAHAGRKASTLAPWVVDDVARTWSTGRNIALEDEHGWPDNGAILFRRLNAIHHADACLRLMSFLHNTAFNVVWAPSDLQYASDYPKPKAATEAYLDYVEKGFLDAVERCKKIGCESWFSPPGFQPNL